MGAVPRHVLTSDYWGGYAGTHNVPAAKAAPWLSFAMVSPQDSNVMHRYGVRSILYTNPNREQPHDPMWTDQEAEYAHDCSGQRVVGETAYAGQLLTDPASPAMKAIFKNSVERHMEEARYDFVFVDEAVGATQAQGRPCNYTLPAWLAAEGSLMDSMRLLPIIYNGLSDMQDRGVAPELALNAHAAGGEMEECYAQLDADHRVGGWRWYATEQTELRMAQQHKYFICYGRDLTPAEQAYPARLYTYASFLLTYDPNTTILWEYYKTPSGGHVMPESQLVALDPVKPVRGVAALREPGGAYVRRYRSCYLGGRAVGPCAAAVNPDDRTRSVDLSAYRHTLRLQGSGVFDGGRVDIVSGSVPQELAPLEAVIAFR